MTRKDIDQDIEMSHTHKIITEKEIKDYYNKYHLAKGENAWRPPEAYSLFLDCLNVKQGQGGNLLDIGCGTGYFLKEASKKNLKTYGIDVSEEGVKIARVVSPESEITVGRGENLRFPDEFFDYVTCIGALEHFLDMSKALKEMKRVGKKSAKYLVVVPNVNYLLWKFKGLKGTEQRDINETLLSLDEWRRLFLSEGFEIIGIYKDKWPGKIKVFSSTNPVRILKNIIYKIFYAIHPLKYTYQFIFILRKG